MVAPRLQFIWTDHAREQLALRCGDQADPAGVVARCRLVTGKKAAKLLRRNCSVRADAVFHDSQTDAILICRPPTVRVASAARVVVGPVEDRADTDGPTRWVIVTVYGPTLRRKGRW